MKSGVQKERESAEKNQFSTMKDFLRCFKEKNKKKKDFFIEKSIKKSFIEFNVQLKRADE